jgi:hypothetical protein
VDWTMIHYPKTSQNTAHIARTVVNVAICRALLRSIYGAVYRPPVNHYRPLPQVPPADRRDRNLLFSRSFMLYMTPAVDAGDVLRAFPDDP